MSRFVHSVAFGRRKSPNFSRFRQNPFVHHQRSVTVSDGVSWQVNIGRHQFRGTLYESSAIPFLVPRHKVWLTRAAGMPCSNAAIRRTQDLDWAQSEFCTRQNSVRGQKPPRQCIYSVPSQETAKDRAKFGWPLMSDVAAETKARCETRLNLLGCPKLPNRSHPLVGRSSPC